jgi:hypothetical protein
VPEGGRLAFGERIRPVGELIRLLLGETRSPA